MEQTLRRTLFVVAAAVLLFSFDSFHVPYVLGFNVVLHVGQGTSTSRRSSMNHSTRSISNPTNNRFQPPSKNQKNDKIQLQMGLFDFFQSRENDFVKLEKTDVYGPGPIIILYNTPSGIADDEIQDMIDDGMGMSSSNVKFVRLDPSDFKLIGNDVTVSQVLEKINANEFNLEVDKRKNSIGIGGGDNNNTAGVPILFFSGTSNAQMMQTYNIIAREIYEETGGAANAACAKVVEPAMAKSFRQVIEEIAGDHTDALRGQAQAA